MLESDTEFGRSGQGGDGAHSWTGKSGFCKERWLFWEVELLSLEMRFIVLLAKCKLFGEIWRALKNELPISPVISYLLVLQQIRLARPYNP